jgi:hypothetical protein
LACTLRFFARKESTLPLLQHQGGSLSRASFRLTSRFPLCVSLRLSLLLPIISFQITSFSPCRAH